MILIADDHGCKPNGRFLERVTIAAGSVVLTDTDRQPEFLLSFVRTGDAVFVHSVDRLARNLDDLAGSSKS